MEYASGEGHRKKALRLATADPCSDPETVLPIEPPERLAWGVHRDFPEVPMELLREERWTTLSAFPWKFREAIHVLEGRAAVSAARRIA